jgi:hypothetical protein
MKSHRRHQTLGGLISEIGKSHSDKATVAIVVGLINRRFIRVGGKRFRRSVVVS